MLDNTNYTKQEIQDLRIQRDHVKDQIKSIEKEIEEGKYRDIVENSVGNLKISTQEKIFEKCVSDFMTNFDEAMELEKAHYDLEKLLTEARCDPSLEKPKKKWFKAQEKIMEQVVSSLDVNLNQRMTHLNMFTNIFYAMIAEILNLRRNCKEMLCEKISKFLNSKNQFLTSEQLSRSQAWSKVRRRTSRTSRFNT